MLGGVRENGIEQQIGNVVGQRTSDQEFHRKVVDAFDVVALVTALAGDPTLRQDVANRSRQRFKAFSRIRYCRVDGVIEKEVAFVESVGRSRKGNSVAT